MTTNGRNWKKCPKGHVVGEIVREIVVHDGRRAYATRLRLYRLALTEAQAEIGLGDGDVVAVLEGTAPEVFCSECKASVPWIIGQAEMARLVERWMQRKRMVVA